MLEIKSINLWEALQKVDLRYALNLSPSKDGEEIIGTLDENLVRLEILRQSIHKEARAEEIALDKKYSKDHIPILGFCPECEEYEKQKEILRKKAIQLENLNKIFWSTLRLQFPEHTDKVLAIREGGKIVLPKQEEFAEQVADEIMFNFLFSNLFEKK